MEKLLTEEKDTLFKTITCFYEAKEIGLFSLEDMLIHIITILKEEVEAIMNYLEHHIEVDDFVEQIIKMINAMETLQMHFEFTLEALGTQSPEEFEALKKKYEPISKGYEKAKSKEDLTPVPAKYVIALFLDKVIIEFKRVMKSCFRKNHYGELELIKDEEHLARLKVLTARFEAGGSHFHLVIIFPKDDIFCLEKSSPLWQDLYKHVTFKQILTKKEVIESSRLFVFFLYISHLVVQNKINNRTSPFHQATFSLLKDLIYYGLQRTKAEAPALVYLLNADIREVFRAWNTAEHPLIAKYYLAGVPKIGYDELIYVPRLFPEITREVILKEYEENSYNKLAPMDLSKLINIPVSEDKDEIIKNLFVPREDKIPIRILSHRKFNFAKTNNFFKGIFNKIKGANSHSEEVEEAIVIHLHGGGFVAMSSGTHRIYLNKWVKSLNLTHFSIDYRLAPVNKFPDALDDVWQAYLWIINFASSVLGINYKKIILVGDSAGGNLALALMLRLVRAGMNPPQGCLLIYPCLYVDANSFSPSYFESFDDPMLPYALLKLVAKAYVPEGFKNLEDPFISPMLASYELLENLPPIRIVVGSRDPLHDDNWRLLAKLRKLNKDVKMIVHANLSHGFLCHNELKNYDYFVEEGCELVRELMSLASI